MTEEEQKSNIFSKIQFFLKNPPVIIWGSGATIPFGFPSMDRLNTLIKESIPEFDQTNTNLEIELGKESYKDSMSKIKHIIWEEISRVNEIVLGKILIPKNKEFEGITKLIKKFISAHPQVVNIITTNYDCTLENVLSFNGISFSDGFLGKELSSFDENLFVPSKNVNIVKVHGSLNWFEVDDEIRYLFKNLSDTVPQIICPGKNKYQEAYKSPYRELIQKADSYIDTANSFLIVGFGFNDEHLTPKIKAKVKKGIPIVVICKNITDSCLNEIKNAEKYVLIEEYQSSDTKITFKDGGADEQIISINGNFWSLNNFIEIL
jgi:hypothetical protein